MQTTERAPSRAERSRQIIAVLAKHGLAVAGHRTMGPVEAREACEELGTTFIKLAQLLGARADLLPREYREELAKLQDDVAPVDASAIEARIESELGAPPDELFAAFDRVPLA